MRFRNSLRLLLCNFKTTYKMLLYKLVVFVITAALAAALVYPSLQDILKSAEVAQLVSDVKGFLKAIVTLDTAYLGGFHAAFAGEGGTLSALIQLLRSETLGIVLALVLAAVIYVAQRFLNTVCHFAVGGILNDRMATYGETPFSDAYIKNLGRACVYSITYVGIVFAYDLIVAVVGYFLFLGLVSVSNVFIAGFVLVMAIVFAQAYKLTLTCMWMPAMLTDHQRLRDAMKSKDKTTRKQRQNIFLTYVTTVYFILVLNVVAAVCTMGSALIVTIPASYLLLICEQFVNYYTVKGKKYFVTYESVVVNPSYGRNDNFFAAMESATLESALPVPFMENETREQPAPAPEQAKEEPQKNTEEIGAVEETAK